MVKLHIVRLDPSGNSQLFVLIQHQALNLAVAAPSHQSVNVFLCMKLMLSLHMS